jgi:hypothetical protein
MRFSLPCVVTFLCALFLAWPAAAQKIPALELSAGYSSLNGQGTGPFHGWSLR